ncbi:MAG: type V CRISPR-associated protein Cas12a/Cpf1 [Sulfurospirillaceae bacterium]|nr:type V CRISPR-associated protein Cas12a/Cpf1 [Sulfurospirillaceae bacterium]
MFLGFINKYQLSKTLRFELKPIGKTLEFIEQKGLIVEDEARAEDYKRVKELIDKYHKEFIHQALSGIRLDGLDRYEELFFIQNRDEKTQKEFEKLQDDLRKQIVAGFKAHEAFKNIDKKELITVELPKFLKDEKDKKDREIVKKFDSFTTYFTGFHENRKNIYSDKAQHSSIGYRVIHENLSIFLSNKRAFESIQQNFPEIAQTAQNSLLEHLEGGVVEDMFGLDYFSRTLTQTYIDIYNTMLGGKVLKDGTKIQGLNEHINLYRQKYNIEKRKLPNLKALHKQILSDRESMSWLHESFANRDELNSTVEKFYKESIISFKQYNDAVDITEELINILSDESDYDLGKVFVKNDISLTAISQEIFKDYRVIKDALWQKHLADNPKATKSKDITVDEEKYFSRKNSYFSISQIEKALNKAELSDEAKKEKENYKGLFDFFKTKVAESSKAVKENFTDWQNNKEDKKLTKSLLDSMLNLQRAIKPLSVKAEDADDRSFYALFSTYFESLSGVIRIYDKVRNFESKKPYSMEKFKLNFENKGNFLGGWVDSSTEKSDNGTQSGGYLFRKRNGIGEFDYYLGISSDPKLFRSHLQDEIEKEDISDFERLDYYQLKSATVFGNSYVGDSYSKDRDLLYQKILEFVENTEPLKADIDKYVSSQKGTNQPTPSGIISIVKEKYPELLQKLKDDQGFSEINKTVTDRLKKTILSLHRIPRSQEYKNHNFSLFTEAIEVIEELSSEKSFAYFKVSKSELENALNRDSKPLFLFKITNKDLSFADSFIAGKRKSRGTDNLHTLYFKALMSGSQNVFDIGTGEVFYRKEDYKGKKIVHKANEPIENKNRLNDKKHSLFEYDIVKNRRYLVDKFQFHLSIVQNYIKPKKYPDFNTEVNQAIKGASDIKVIGVDRGERHLLYLSLIDSSGRIVEQYSLNQIINSHNGKKHIVDYHQKLADKEKERAEARENWGVVENIKELKEGYMSHVIHRIATLMVKHNAIVALEDLNFGFKRGRFKVEKQVYQKFEKMLIDKLNYLVDKQKSPNELGGLLKAFQLTNKFVSFEKLGKQSGFLFYVPAWNTSKIDPVTGFVNLLDTRYQSIEKSKEFFSKFDAIRYNDQKGYFEFEFDYKNFTTKADGTRTKWTLCTYGTRIKTFRNRDKNHQWDNVEVDLTAEFKSLFGLHSGDLKELIISQDRKEFFETLLYLLRLTLQMRNSVTNSEIDYLISPVADKNGNFYDSRVASDDLPRDADANGAYNIARKGLMIIEKIAKSKSGEKLNLTISNKEWLAYAQR